MAANEWRGLAVEGALNDLAGIAWDTASDDELLAAARDLETWSRRLYAVTLAVTAELDTRGVATTHGATSTAVLLRQLLRISPGQARRRIADARSVRPAVAITGEILAPALPVAAAAVEAGTISDQHLLVIRRTVERLPSAVEGTVRAGVESQLVDHATQFDPVQLVKLAHRVRAHLDPDGTLLDERQAVARRELSFVPDLDGTVTIRGRLDAEAAAIVQTALDPLAAPLPADPQGVKDTRTPARRRADALVQAARLLLDAGVLPTQGGQRPHLTVTITLDNLRANTEDDSDTDTGTAGGTARGTGGGTADLDSGAGTITAGAARRIACDAHIIPVVLGGRSEPLDVGRAAYTVPQPMRRALIARDRGCTFPGCDRPPGWCESHHIVHWADGGPTALTNLALLCDVHHRLIHAQEWHIRIADGHPEFIAPRWLDPHQTPIRNTIHHLHIRHAAETVDPGRSAPGRHGRAPRSLPPHPFPGDGIAAVGPR
jgi:hypothetical protein